MSKRLVVGSLLAVAAGLPAFSATAPTWYVAASTATSVCIVTPSKPNGTTYKMVGSAAFVTVEEATASMRANKDCVAKANVAAAKTKVVPVTTGSVASSATPVVVIEPDPVPVFRAPPDRQPYDVFPDDDNIKASDEPDLAG